MPKENRRTSADFTVITNVRFENPDAMILQEERFGLIANTDLDL